MLSNLIQSSSRTWLNDASEYFDVFLHEKSPSFAKIDSYNLKLTSLNFSSTYPRTCVLKTRTQKKQDYWVFLGLYKKIRTFTSGNSLLVSRLVWRNKTEEKLDIKISFFFRYNFAKHELAKLLTIYMTTRDHPRSKPHGPGPTGVGGLWNLKNHWISPTYRLSWFIWNWNIDILACSFN